MILAVKAVLAAGAASAALASGPHFSAAISPAAFHARPGTTHAVRVTDGGPAPLTLHMSVTEVAAQGRACAVSQRQVRWAHVTPATVRLRPGQTATTWVSVARHVPASGRDLAVNAEAATPHGAHVAVVADVASQMIVGHQAGCKQHRSHHVPLTVVSAGLSGPALGGLGLLAFVVLGVIPFAAIRLRRHSGTRRRAALASHSHRAH